MVAIYLLTISYRCTQVWVWGMSEEMRLIQRRRAEEIGLLFSLIAVNLLIYIIIWSLSRDAWRNHINRTITSCFQPNNLTQNVNPISLGLGELVDSLNYAGWGACLPHEDICVNTAYSASDIHAVKNRKNGTMATGNFSSRMMKYSKLMII